MYLPKKRRGYVFAIYLDFGKLLKLLYMLSPSRALQMYMLWFIIMA
jgi:hypothetical protein